MPNILETTDAAAGTGTTYTLGLNQTGQGQLSSGTDHDWYAVSLVAGQTYTFAMTGTGTFNLADSYLRLYNSAGSSVLAEDDNTLPNSHSVFTYTATQTGTFFLDAGAGSSGDSGQYGVSFSSGSKANFDTEMGAGVIDTNASWSATAGTGVNVTYAFRSTAASYTVPGSNIGSFTQLTAHQIDIVRYSLQVFSEVCGLTFTEVNPGGYSDDATMLFSNYTDANDGAGAFAYYPGSTASSAQPGDVWLNTTSVATSGITLGSYSLATIIHEIGHAVGLSHTGNYNAAPGVSITYSAHAQQVQDSSQYSIMSYFDESETGASDYGSDPDSFMLFDILALQSIYGANTSTRATDTVYGFGSTAGSLYDFASNTTPVFSIWDGGGVDTLNASGFSQAQTLNLNQAGFSNLGGMTRNVSIALNAVIENAVGGSGADTLLGNSGANTLTGAGGADSYTGGSGDDLFVYQANSGHDTIVDFTAGAGGVDEIDLRGYSNVNTLADILARATQIGANTYIDFGTGHSITLSNVLRTSLVESDFLMNAPPGPSVSISDVSVTEGNSGTKLLTFTLSRAGSSGAFSVNWASANGTATAGSDYTAASGTASFAAGVNSQTISITIAGDTTVEANETFAINLSGATGGATISDAQGVGTITNDDSATNLFTENADTVALPAGGGSYDALGGNDRVTGTSALEIINGGLGDDILDGRLGNDTLDGDGGTDTAWYYYQPTAGVNVSLVTGVATQAGVFSQTLVEIENVLGSLHSDVITGNDLNNALTGVNGNDQLTGNGGNDVLNGGAGADQMTGGLGNDIFYVDDAGDTVVEGLNGGLDQVQSSITITLSANVEVLGLQGLATINATGNDLNNMMVGNNGDNIINGGAGNDTLYGQHGIDQIVAGAGIDNYYGGAGTDYFVFNSLSDSGVGSGNRDTLRDFSRVDDYIYLVNIDANELVGGDQAFVLDTDNSFSVGEIGLQQAGSYLIVRLNTDADSAAESEIVLQSMSTLANTDFVF